MSEILIPVTRQGKPIFGFKSLAGLAEFAESAYDNPSGATEQNISESVEFAKGAARDFAEWQQREWALFQNEL